MPSDPISSDPVPNGPTSFLPLTVPTFYILLSLAPGKKHGYAILGDIARLSKGEVQLSTSTLYSALTS